MGLRISDHAKEHMTRCGISEQDVVDVLCGKCKILKKVISQKDESCSLIFAEVSGKICKIVYSETSNTIVTAFTVRRL